MSDIRFQYQRLHHLHRLRGFLMWRIAGERVPTIKQALDHRAKLINMEIESFPTRLRYVVLKERDEMLLSRPLKNSIGVTQVHSANPGSFEKYEKMSQFWGTRYRVGKHEVFPQILKGRAS